MHSDSKYKMIDGNSDKIIDVLKLDLDFIVL